LIWGWIGDALRELRRGRLSEPDSLEEIDRLDVHCHDLWLALGDAYGLEEDAPPAARLAPLTGHCWVMLFPNDGRGRASAAAGCSITTTAGRWRSTRRCSG
jgi:hypothetical protein